jgi:hypothetical protein
MARMMLISIALLTAERWIVRVATASEIVNDKVFMPYSSLAPLRLPACGVGILLSGLSIGGACCDHAPYQRLLQGAELDYRRPPARWRCAPANKPANFRRRMSAQSGVR